MKNVSLYEEMFEKVGGEVKKVTEQTSDSVLKSFSLKYETRVPKLEKMCYLMEQVLLNKKTEAVVYAGFQKISRARAIWDRFLNIADNVKQVYIFGLKDDQLTPHPNIKFVYLPKNHKLTKEWFLIIDKPIGKSMMTAYDLDGFGVHADEKSRNFRGVKSNNPTIVKKAVNLLQEVVA